jgi:hypothetical protein
MNFPGWGDAAKAAARWLKAPSMSSFVAAGESAIWAQHATLVGFLKVGAAFETGVTIGAAVDAYFLHPCAGK